MKNPEEALHPVAARLGIEELMAGYQRGDEAAAAQLVEVLSPALCRFFTAQGVRPEEAQDSVQETWLRIHRARHTYRAGTAVLPWAYAIARHVRVDRYRRQQKFAVREIQMEQLPERPALAPQGGPALEALLSELPDSQREVLLMLKGAGLSLEEVARATSSTVGAVKQKAHRAYVKLRGLLAAKGGVQ